jgi:hypothetical protein
VVAEPPILLLHVERAVCTLQLLFDGVRQVLPPLGDATLLFIKMPDAIKDLFSPHTVHAAMLGHAPSLWHDSP